MLVVFVHLKAKQPQKENLKTEGYSGANNLIPFKS